MRILRRGAYRATPGLGAPGTPAYAGSSPSRGDTSPNSPRAERQQGSVSSVGCARGLRIPARGRGRTSPFQQRHQNLRIERSLDDPAGLLERGAVDLDRLSTGVEHVPDHDSGPVLRPSERWPCRRPGVPRLRRWSVHPTCRRSSGAGCATGRRRPRSVGRTRRRRRRHCTLTSVP